MSDTPRTEDYLAAHQYASNQFADVEALIDFARQLERELSEARAENAALKDDWSNRMRNDLFNYLDGLAITSGNIGEIRGALLLPFDCEWNAVVRDQTAARENAAIDAARKP